MECSGGGGGTIMTTRSQRSAPTCRSVCEATKSQEDHGNQLGMNVAHKRCR
jgi:hypothetical protein